MVAVLVLAPQGIQPVQGGDQRLLVVAGELAVVRGVLFDARGVLEARDVLYFAMLIAFFLFTTAVALDLRKAE